MRKLIYCLFAMFVTILSANAQDEQSLQEKIKELGYRQVNCWCHFDNHNGKPFKRCEKSIIYYTPIKIYNDNNEITSFELHYDKPYYSSRESFPDIEPIDTVFKDAKEYCLLMKLHNQEEIAKKFKYGYIDKWSWNTNSVDGIDFNIDYTNTNTKTIKYIDIYFIVKNPVGDICKIYYNNSNIAHLRCVGPIKQYHTGSYSWDACYYTTGDASNLYFTKFVITYMDNTKYTLVKELAYKYYPFD